MSGTGDVDHVQVMPLDDPVEMDVDEVRARRRPPMAKKPWFYVSESQRLSEQRIVVQVDLAHRQIVRSPPVGIHLPELDGSKGRFHVSCPASPRNGPIDVEALGNPLAATGPA